MVSFDALGTRWTISGEVSAPVLDTVRERLTSFDTAYSRFRTDSLVSRMAREAGTYCMPDDFGELWRMYSRLHRVTDGAFTPLVGTLLEDLGYDAAYSMTARPSRPVPLFEGITWEAPNLTLTEPALLDFGAGGKGYAADIVSSVLLTEGVAEHMVNASGDIVHRSTAPLSVGLEDPNDSRKVVGRIDIHNESICGSAGNRRRIGDMHHIINPHTRRSPQDVLATWVIAPTALEADSLATALYFTEPEKLAEMFSFEWAVLLPDSTTRSSERFREAWFAR